MVTNRGKYLILGAFFRNETAPSNFYVALVTSATAPDADTDTLGDLTEIASGNGYTAGGVAVARSSVGFDVWSESDADDRGAVQLADVTFTASGGPLPASGDGARYAVLLDDNATAASRQVIAVWDLDSDRAVSDGQSLTLQDLEIRANDS